MTANLSSQLGLPSCSLNRRSFRSGCRPPRAIEISQGDREIGSRASVNLGVEPYVVQRQLRSFRTSSRASNNKNSHDSRSPDLPVSLARSSRPKNATEASAIRAAVWQPKM